MAALVLLGQGPEHGVFRDGAPGGETEAGDARSGALHACSQQLAPIEIRRVSIARLCHEEPIRSSFPTPAYHGGTAGLNDVGP